MDITIWDIMVDFGIISVALLIGVILKAKLPFIQRTFMPASFIAGILLLLLGPSALNLLPFSDWLGSYPSVLIAVVFACIPLGASRGSFKEQFSGVRNMWFYGVFVLMLLYFVGLFITQVFLTPTMGVSTGLGMMIGVGFFGGHGSAAAIGETFAELGWMEATDIGYTAATLGMIIAILGGMWLIKRGAENKETNYITSFKDLPTDLRTGLVPRKERTSMGDVTFSPNAVDPFLAHAAIVGLAILVAYGIQLGLEGLIPGVSIPLFSMAIIAGVLVQIGLRSTRSDDYVDKRIIDRISGTATDLIVVCGIASINLTVVADYIVPLLILVLFGIIAVYLSFRFLAPRTFHQNWFENAIFNWGYTTGTVAMGVALLKMVDPHSKSGALRHYGIAYLGIMPFEVVTLAVLPGLLVSGFGWTYTVFTFLVCFILLLVFWKRGWIGRSESTTTSN
jgi:ESS family glutamate:Na+ symporter